MERLDLDGLKAFERGLAQLAGYLVAEDHRAEHCRNLAPK
jgi:predicted phage gp36 major capsid-like protein